MLDVFIENVRKHLEINKLRAIHLYQAFRALMPKGSVFAATSSLAGQVGEDIGFSAGACGVSKAALNVSIARIGYEGKDIVALAVQYVRPRSLVGVLSSLRPVLLLCSPGKHASDVFGMRLEDWRMRSRQRRPGSRW